ncbi:MAG: LPS-assembly protein LptD @ Organic solvent tolerance protein precursor [uncultured Paraburkholderia sp.]|nr:MAG: LPS-assembly protein LptD @ Organic solvent tolerance protein precursor [uncultured Paraburkholderia sp.]CAH2801200.1 MAG: LPS-assembly protein LptD @ Organic solvent tolerance protein precursor [uncultured Paraburkholderia sp.]CAH2935577.1 MAG: LPS-assembly protein LptD @ Organic solvent tolerance protein precursor [uncultured Paraburkholderia sp.]CAH2937279.1 MAG: LPS-assembly protein LptD @ Organic solvent tolerance protein precursor [uncultured Paraburkholderia sp.]
MPRKRRLVAALIAVPGLVPALAHAQLVGEAAQPQPIEPPWGMQFAPQLEDHVLQPGQKPATFVLGDSTNGTTDQDLAVKGAAEVRRNTVVIKSDALHYDQDSDMADAYGQVRLNNNGTMFAGPEAHMRVDSSEGFMTAPKYHFNVTGGSGSAERVDLLDNERSVFTKGTYTACACTDNPAWYIKGSEFDFDTGADEGVAYNSVLFFQGVPVFASPWLSFPLSGERRSGILPPTFSLSSTNGFELSVPYYFNIAPNRDLTLTPRLISKRGVQLQSAFRYLSPTYSGSITGEFLPNDRLTKTNRYALYIQHNQNFGNGFGGYIYYNKVSDNTYPEDLSSSANQFMNGTQLLYQQEAGLTYNNGPWSVLAREQHWQTLTPSVAPYGREPQLNVKYAKYNVGGFDFGAEADYTNFRITTADMTQGQRVMFNPYISYSVVGPGYFVTPKVQWHFASYNLNNISNDVPAGTPKNFTESIPTLSFDTGLIFDRSVRLFGEDYIQTLEPRLYYVYTPYRNQASALLFDTAESDFGLAEIFTPNTFVGNDRIADANRLTAAITTRFINPATGDERARFVIAQQYYFQDQRVTLLPNQTSTQATHSDLIVGASLKLGAGFASETAFQYNADNNQLVKTSVGFGFSPATGKVLNVAYRYTRANTTLENEPINQVLVSGQWPLSHRVFGVGRFNYDLGGHRIVDGLVGLQYDADCWTLGAGIQRYANGLNTSGQHQSSTRFLAQLTFKGLSSVDNGLIAAFRSSVAGYTPLPPPPPPESRFINYE